MKNVLILSMIALLGSCGGGICDRKTCTTDPKCKCWCSVKCGYRDKNASDRPIYVEDDKNGKGCYCKQWDYDHYVDNCVEHKNIQQ